MVNHAVLASFALSDGRCYTRAAPRAPASCAAPLTVRRPALDPAFFGMATLPLEGGDNWQLWTSSPGLSLDADAGFVAVDFSGTKWVRAVRTVAEEPGARR